MSIKTSKELETHVRKLARMLHGAVILSSEKQYNTRVFYVIGSGTIYRISLANEYGDAIQIKVIQELEYDV